MAVSFLIIGGTDAPGIMILPDGHGGYKIVRVPGWNPEQMVELGAALDVLAEKYPQYVEQPPPGPLLRLEPETCGCWRAAPASTDWPRSRPHWACRRAPRTASCAPCSGSNSSNRTRKPAGTSSAPRCCTWAPAISTRTNCAHAR